MFSKNVLISNKKVHKLNQGKSINLNNLRMLVYDFLGLKNF